MYASPEQRAADIEAGARRPAGELIAWFEGSAAALDDGFSSLSAEAWEHPVRTAQGRTVPASETPWMRAREVLVHAVDLDAGVTFHDLPAAFLHALEEDIRAKRAASGQDVPRVTGEDADVVAWLAGRPHGPLTAADGAPADLPPRL